MAIDAVQSSYADMAARLNGGVNGSGAGAPSSAVQDMSDRFLKLLVTQLKNQDPMNPMDNAQLTMQLAQMSTVEGVNKLNDGLAALVTQFQTSQAMQGASLVGRQVLAEGDVLQLSGSGAVGGLVLEGRADSVQVRILDDLDNLVQVLDLGSQEQGLVRFVWDGSDALGNPLADGAYRFQVMAAAAGMQVDSTPYALGQVLSVALNDGAMAVEVAGLGNVGLEQIRQIF